MKGTFLLLLLLVLVNYARTQGTAINTDGSPADSSAILDIKSTNQGLLIPRVSGDQRGSIANPATGLLVFDPAGNGTFFYKSPTNWAPLSPWSYSAGSIFPVSLSNYVGIGTQAPLAAMDVASNGVSMILENIAPLSTGLTTAMYFKSSDQYYGGIKAIATSINTGRLGFFTYAEPDSSVLNEQLSILDNGNVGINTITPTSTLEVNGTASVDGLLRVGSSTYGSSLPAVVSVTSGGEQIYQTTVAISATITANSLAGLTANLSFSGATFSAPPNVYVGNIVTSTENGDWYKVTLLIDNITTTGATVKLFNPTGSTISFIGVSWNVVVIGPR